MKKIREIRIDGNFILGSTITFTAILDYEPGVSDTVKISIEDDADSLKIDAASMTKLANNVYQYSYQSSITDNDGSWMATIKATDGSSIIYDAKSFELLENPLEF